MTNLYGCIKIDFNDLNTYRDNLSLEETNNLHLITNLLMLKSEIQVGGLKALHDSLNSSTKPSIAELKEKYTEKLLKDLELLTKRKDFQDVKNIKQEPENFEFKAKFYEEIKKPATEISSELNNFLSSCANLIDDTGGKNTLTTTEAISAKMLLEFNKPNITSENIAASLENRLNAYKQVVQGQTTKDIGGTITDINGNTAQVDPRAEILFKDKSGNTRIINAETIKNESSLTGEQKDFITTLWHQGTFGAGWFPINAFTKNFQGKMEQFYPNGTPDMNRERDFLMVEVAEGNKVIVRSRSNMGIHIDPTSSDESVDYAQGVLEVDITNLKGKDFIPGCASKMPKMNVYISEFNKDIRYDLPKKLKISQDVTNDNIRQTLFDDKKIAYINEIIAGTPKADVALESLSQITGLDEKTLNNFQEQGILVGLKKIELREIQSLPEDAKIESLAVKCFKNTHKNSEERKNFAKEQLDKYCDKTNVKILDDKEIKRLKTGIISILEPIIKDEKEKATLEANIGAALRKCAKMANKEMSFGQKWRSIVIDPIKQLFKKDKLEAIIDKHPEIVKAFKQPSNIRYTSLSPQSSLKSNKKERPER
ncbi:hypothetical protein [Rickettsia endosymbiont of Polydrusus tereticollis]|uniref:hypothetical protein n=1 Tax=Rickettsia endosymbiont of Polydrusus tereticollis TaxID=3066251 RepID=UPI003132F6C2